MHKLNLKFAVATLLAAACFSSAMATEKTPTVSASNNVLRGATDMATSVAVSARPKMPAIAESNSVSRSNTDSASTALEESNTIGMLLAGLAIMGLVVRRRMNQS